MLVACSVLEELRFSYGFKGSCLQGGEAVGQRRWIKKELYFIVNVVLHLVKAATYLHQKSTR